MHLGVARAVLFFVELGGAINESSTAVPSLSISPLGASVAFTASSIFGASSYCSSRCRKRRMLTRSGSRFMPPNPANCRYSGTSNSASSIATSDSPNHCCSKWMRNIASTPNGGRPLSLRGACGSISANNALHGTTRFISSRNLPLRVLRLVRSKPRSVRFMPA